MATFINDKTNVRNPLSIPDNFSSEKTTYHKFRIDDLPIDRNARRIALTERFEAWYNHKQSPFAYIMDEVKWFKDKYALYQSMLNIITRGDYPEVMTDGKANIWWRPKMQNYMVIYKTRAHNPQTFYYEDY